mgnify:CR=1 FL=1
MDIDLALFYFTTMLQTAVMVSAPVLVTCLIVGLLVSIFQVVTQIQEMTLTFVPKLIAVVFVIFIFGRWMLIKLVEYSSEQLAQIPHL